MDVHIECDRQKLLAASSAIRSYITDTKTELRKCSQSVSSLEDSWSGDDYNQCKEIWNQIVNGESVYTQISESMEKFADYLENAAIAYENAQAEAIRKANSIWNLKLVK